MSPAGSPLPGIADPPTPPSVQHLELVRERNEGSRTQVNRFLRRHHPEGGVPHWVAAWSARYRDYMVAVIVLNRPARMVDDDAEINIQRLARRDDRPANSCSWLIARARTWAHLEGYERIAAHAGVAGNFGTAYEAAGFLLDCPHCDWRGNSSDLLERVVDEDLAEAFPIYDQGEVVEVCPECDRPPAVVADGEGWQTLEGREARDDYLRRKWVDHV